jgi:hypothetical protein
MNILILSVKYYDWRQLIQGTHTLKKISLPFEMTHLCLWSLVNGEGLIYSPILIKMIIVIMMIMSAINNRNHISKIIVKEVNDGRIDDNNRR